MSKEDLIKQIAALDGDTAVAELAEELEGKLDPTLFLDDALTYFKYGGKDERNAQADFLIEIRDNLVPRKGEIEDAGYNWSKFSLVKIDKLLNQIDGLLGVNQVATLRKLMSGDCKGACADTSLLPSISDQFAAVMKDAAAIQEANTSRNFAGLEGKLQSFDQQRRKLSDLLASVDHVALRDHLKSWLLEPATRFASGPAHGFASDVIANKTSAGFHKKWKEVKNRAEKQFEQASKNRGKKQKLSDIVAFESGLGDALDKMEEAKKKGKDFSGHKASAIQVATNYLRALDRIENDWRDSQPDFYTPLHQALGGLLASLQSYS
jgi:hypothetical protein